MRIKTEHQIVAGPVPRTRRESHSFRAPAIGKRGGGGAQRVHARVGRRRGVVPLEETRGGFGAALFCPAFPQPLRMRPTEGRVFGFEFGEQGDRRVAFAGIAAQDGVQKTRLRTAAQALGSFDGFVDGGVIGNAPEPEHLVQPEAQHNLQQRLLRAARGLADDEPVERALPAHGPVHQFLAEAAIGGRQPGLRQRRVEEVFDEVRAAFATQQHFGGNFPWFLIRHDLIMPFALAGASHLKHL